MIWATLAWGFASRRREQDARRAASAPRWRGCSPASRCRWPCSSATRTGPAPIRAVRAISWTRRRRTPGSSWRRFRCPPVAARAPARRRRRARRARPVYARAFERLLAGYYILDRNYNYDFHNRLFLRSTPLLADYRRVGLTKVARGRSAARRGRCAAGARARRAGGRRSAGGAARRRACATPRSPSGARRCSSGCPPGSCETEAGLQHATHIYEGEGKVLGRAARGDSRQASRGACGAGATAAVTAEFSRDQPGRVQTYANRIVGF